MLVANRILPLCFRVVPYRIQCNSSSNRSPYSILCILFTFISGPKQDYESAREFICRMFVNCRPEKATSIYPHFTCATDTNNIKYIFEVVKNHILQSHIIEVIPGI